MKTRNKVLATVIAGLISTSAVAANDGLLNETASTGDFDLQLQVLDSVQITGMVDMNFGTYGAANTGNINRSNDFCVFRNGGDSYTITTTSSNGKFSLIGAAATPDEIDYTVRLAGSAGAGVTSATPIVYNTASTFTGSAARNCSTSGGVNAAVDVSITEAEITQASTDTYTDTLILVVSPI